MSTFHPFPRLPLELRLTILKMTVEPREVEVRIVKPKLASEGPLERRWSNPSHWWTISRAKFEEAMSHVSTTTRSGRRARRRAWDQWEHYHPYVHLTSLTIPAILHASRDARNHGVYQRVFLDGEDQPVVDRRYVWLNLDIDLINIGSWDLAYFLPIATTVKRLKLSRATPEDWDHELDLLSNFNNLEEVQLVCVGGFVYWGEDVDAVKWPCGKEKLRFLEPLIAFTDGSPVGYRELKHIYRRYWSAANPEFYGPDYWETDDEYEE